MRYLAFMADRSGWKRLTLGLLVLLALAWVAWCAPGRGARPALGQAQVAPATADAPPVRYALQASAGQHAAPTVALLASLGRPVSDFNELAASLHAAGYRTLAVESRGVGAWAGGGPGRRSLEALADDVLRALAHAGVPPAQPVYVVGHAFGNRVARTFATIHPERTAGVVLVAAGDKTHMAPELERALTVANLGFLPWAAREQAVNLAFFAPGNPVPGYWRDGWSLWGALAQAAAAKAAAPGAFHAGGSAPMLVLQAQQDTIAPPRDAGQVLKARYGERVTLVPIEHAGHALLPEQPQAIAKAVLAFLAAHPVRARGAAQMTQMAQMAQRASQGSAVAPQPER